MPDRGHPSGVNFGSHGALKQADGDHDTVASFETLQNPLEAAESAILDPHPLTGLQVRPRFAAETGIHERAESSNFALVHRNRSFGNPNDGDETRCFKDGKSVLRVESAKEIAGEQGKLQLLDSI